MAVRRDAQLRGGAPTTNHSRRTSIGNPITSALVLRPERGTSMTFLVLLLVGLGFLVILPLILIKLVLGLIFLPFKLLGLVFRVVFGVTFGLVGLVFRLLFSGVGLVLALLVAVGVALLVPLIPIVLIGVGLWLLVRSTTRRPPPLRLSA